MARHRSRRTRSEDGRVPRRLRDKLLRECGHKCSIPFCPVRHDLDVHHINGNPKDHDEANLVVLCRPHHRQAHGDAPPLTEGICRQLKLAIAMLDRALSRNKQQLRAAWEDVRTGDDPLEERREMFAGLVEELLRSVPGLVVTDKRRGERRDSMTLVIRNEAKDSFLRGMASYFLIECRARKRPALGRREVTEFVGAMTVAKREMGLLFSVAGWGRGAGDLACCVSRKEFRLALFGPEEIEHLMDAEDRSEPIKQAFERTNPSR